LEIGDGGVDRLRTTADHEVKATAPLPKLTIPLELVLRLKGYLTDKHEVRTARTLEEILEASYAGNEE
jgi:hypothetical protein